MEKKRLKAKERDKDRPGTGLDQQRMELKQKTMPISMEKKITDKKLLVEKKKVENKEKVADIKENGKLTVKFTYSKLDKNISK